MRVQERDKARQAARNKMRAALDQLQQLQQLQQHTSNGHSGAGAMEVDSDAGCGADSGDDGEVNESKPEAVYGCRDVESAAPVQLLKGLLAEVEKRDAPCEVPSAFTCPITMEVFRDPVITPAGHSYERSALLDHLKKVNRGVVLVVGSKGGHRLCGYGGNAWCMPAWGVWVHAAIQCRRQVAHIGHGALEVLECLPPDAATLCRLVHVIP